MANAEFGVWKWALLDEAEVMVLLLGDVLRHFSDARMTDGEHPSTCIALQTLYSCNIDSAQSARTLVVCDARGQHFEFLRVSFNRSHRNQNK